MDPQLIGSELVVEIGVEIKRRKHTYSRNLDTESYIIIVNITVLISMALEGGHCPHFKLVGGGGHVPLVPPCFRHLCFYWLEFVCLLNTCAFPYKDMYRNGWLVGK